jgi:hypothetical protein
MLAACRRAVLALMLSTCAVNAMAEPPATVVNTLCRPTFELKDQSLSAGTAFLMESGVAKQPVVLVTAHHLLGPMGGLSTEVAWNDVPKAVKRATCQSIVTPAQSWIGTPLAIPGAASFNNQTKDAGARGAQGFNLAGISGNVVRKALESVK